MHFWNPLQKCTVCLLNHIVIWMGELVLLRESEDKIKTMITFLLGDKVSKNDIHHALEELHKQGLITDNEISEIKHLMNIKKGLASC